MFKVQITVGVIFEISMFMNAFDILVYVEL
jgi:hypothetical protein